MMFTIRDLHQAYRDQSLTILEATRYFLDRIELLNPELHAVIIVNPRALDIAAEQDASLARGEETGPLHGIPILIKDNIETRELPTTAGSLALKDNFTNRDADVVARLRAAGAIILGKTNLSEWANFRSTRSSSGWSAIGGQTRNPHDQSRSPCGSSSGSAVAVAANLAIAAVGTETDGSIVCPSSLTGIVGLKPSIGLVSQSGIVPISHTQDTAGPMAGNVEDAAILMSSMISDDEINYELGLDENALLNKRVGILRSSANFHEGVDEVFEKAVSTLQKAGAIIVDNVYIKQPKALQKNINEVLNYEFKQNINAYLANLPGDLPITNLQGLIEFNESHEDEEMLYFKQEIFLASQTKGPLTDQVYLDALTSIRQVTRQEGIDKVLQEHRLDVIVAPTAGAAWVIDLVNGDSWPGGGTSSYPAISGYPHITIPMGKLHGLPLGMSFIAGESSDIALLSMAYAFEKEQGDPGNM
jgi:amidase